MPGLLTPRLAFAFALSALAATTPCSCIEPPCDAGPVDSVQQWTDLDGDGDPEALLALEPGYAGFERDGSGSVREAYRFEAPDGFPSWHVFPLAAASGSSAQSAAYVDVSREAFSGDTGGEEQPSFDDLRPQIWEYTDGALERVAVPDIGASYQVKSVAFASADGRTGILMMGPQEWALGVREGTPGALGFVVFEAPPAHDPGFSFHQPALVPLQDAPDRLAFLSHGRQLVYTEVDLTTGEAEHVTIQGHENTADYLPGIAWTHPGFPRHFLVREDVAPEGVVIRSCTTEDWSSGLSTCTQVFPPPPKTGYADAALVREAGRDEPSILIMQRCEDLLLLRGDEEVTIPLDGPRFYLDVRDLDGDGVDELVFPGSSVIIDL